MSKWQRWLDLFDDSGMGGVMFPIMFLMALLFLLFGCTEPQSRTRIGRYVETRPNGAIVIEHEDFCSSSAFDSSRCVWTYYCRKTPLPDIRAGDALHLSGCYNTMQDYVAVLKPHGEPR